MEETIKYFRLVDCIRKLDPNKVKDLVRNLEGREGKAIIELIDRACDIAEKEKILLGD